ncbi:MAG: T9SS type A sorting domain-containing protein [Bacteroidota bacterium]
MYKFLATLLFIFSLSHISDAQSWEKTFQHATGLAKGFDVIQTADHGYVVVGEVDLPTGAIRHYIWLLKTDNDGNLLWSKIYNEPDVVDQKGRTVTEAANGDLFVVGAANNKAIVLKTDAQGEPLWTKEYGGNGVNVFHDASQDMEENLILVGEREEVQGSNQHEVWAMLINTEGDSLWSKTYFEPSFYGTAATVISPLPDNNYLLVGHRNNQGFSLKISGADGTPIWSNLYQFSVGDQIFAATPTQEGTKLIFGGNNTGFAGFSPTLFETNLVGESAVSINYTPTPFGTITALQPTSNNGILMTGSSYDFWSIMGSNRTGFAAKLNHDFTLAWSLTFPDSLDKQGAAIIEDTDGSTIIVGSRNGGIWLKKIGATTNTASIQQEDIQLYPNPAQRNIHISLPSDLADSELDVIFYDAKGVLVFRQKLITPKNQIHLPDLAAGVYNYTIGNESKRWKLGKLVLH